MTTTTTTRAVEGLPIHTATGRWWDGTKEPDWIVLTVRPTGDLVFPFVVLVRYNAQPGMTNPCHWRVPDLNNVRYDLSQAVALPRLEA
jgi:hypothetical protein